jgi:hypothetical protein
MKFPKHDTHSSAHSWANIPENKRPKIEFTVGQSNQLRMNIPQKMRDQKLSSKLFKVTPSEHSSINISQNVGPKNELKVDQHIT